MSERLLGDVSRDNSTIMTGIVVETHMETELEQHGFGGIKPYYRYLCIVQGLYDLHQNDYLVNVKRIDPLTGQLVALVDAANTANALQVVSIVERFPDGHIEFRANDARITGF